MVAWIPRWRRVVCVLLLALAALNVWLSFALLAEHPCLALVNAAVAALPVAGVILLW